VAGTIVHGTPALLDQALLLALARVVGRTAAHPVDSDDRQQHTRTLLGAEKVSRGSAEILASLLGADRRRADGIDHRVNPFERRVQTLASDQINTERAADAYHLMPVPLQERDRARAESVSDYRGALSGTVEFGSLVTFGALDVPKVLGEFHRNYPFVRIRLRQSQTGSIAYLSAIADGSLDLALVSAPDRFPDGIEMRMLSEEPMLFVCRPDHQLAQRDYVGIAELAEEDLIGFPAEFGLRRLVEDAFTGAGITSHTPYEVAAHYEVAVGLVRHGLGTIFMPASEAGRFPDLHAVALRPALIWKIFLASPGPAQIGPAGAKLADLLASAAATPTP
jgi:DNA-binding transcriptional LysR family regulator